MLSRVPISLSFFSGVMCAGLAALGPLSAQPAIDNVAAADAIYQDFPHKETLPPEELTVVLETWDAAALSGDLRTISDAIDLVTHGVPRPYRLRGAHVLRYDNPEIEERFLDLYLSEMERYALTVDTELTLQDVGVDEEVVRGEGYMNYLDALVTPALLTFSPRIYDTVLKGYWGGRTRLTYLSTVRPEYTLDLLLETTLRPRENLDESPDMLGHGTEPVSLSIKQALELLSLLCERSPDAVLGERTRVLDFVRAHALHYLEPIHVGYRPDLSYRSVRDYETRTLALQSLELLAESADVYSVVDDIMRDPPDSPARGANEITREGLRLIERIRALE